MNRCFAVIAVCAAMIFPLTALADPPAAAHPWEKAQAVLKATQSDIQKGGIMAVQAHAPDIEQALAEAGQSFGAAASDKDTVYVLTDGPTETLAAMMAVAGGKYPGATGRKGVAVENPFPAMSFYLGSYYNELGKPAEALRVLDEGLALPTVLNQQFDQHRPFLIGERGAALIALKRWPDALADYEAGLKMGSLNPSQRAYLLRGRGFVLTELSRLDEAEASYNDSLSLEPGNARALTELKYIAGLRAGHPATAGVLTMPNAPKPK